MPFFVKTEIIKKEYLINHDFKQKIINEHIDWIKKLNKDEFSIGLFPGSRFPEILDNFVLILEVLEALSDLRYFQKIQFNFAIVNALSSSKIKEIFQKRGWLKIENLKDNGFPSNIYINDFSKKINKAEL